MADCASPREASTQERRLQARRHERYSDTNWARWEDVTVTRGNGGMGNRET